MQCKIMRKLALSVFIMITVYLTTTYLKMDDFLRGYLTMWSYFATITYGKE